MAEREAVVDAFVGQILKRTLRLLHTAYLVQASKFLRGSIKESGPIVVWVLVLFVIICIKVCKKRDM